LKLWQFDAKYDSGLADETGAFLCWPKGDNTYLEYFTPFRNLASDESARTKVWVDSTGTGFEEVETGFTIDYIDGKVTFDTTLTATDVVKMHFVWNPRVVILDLDPKPQAGQGYGVPKFTPIIVMQEV